MTDPSFADYRAEQEKRLKEEIPHEIGMNISTLHTIGINKKHIRFYQGTPTVFGIATEDRMLLNPYPYQMEAFRCFSIVVMKTNNPNEDIFSQYLKYHFIDPWEKSQEVVEEYWSEVTDTTKKVKP